MSRYATKTELHDLVRDTIDKWYGGTQRYNMAGVFRDLDIIGEDYWGWTFEDLSRAAFERALETNRRDKTQPSWTIRTAPVDDNQRPILPGSSAATGHCPQCDQPLALAELVPHSNRQGDVVGGVLVFSSYSDAWHEDARDQHLFCAACICEYSLDGVTIEFG